MTKQVDIETNRLLLRRWQESDINKTHWNTVTIGGDVPDDALKNMINASYDLIKPKVRKQNKYER